MFIEQKSAKPRGKPERAYAQNGFSVQHKTVPFYAAGAVQVQKDIETDASERRMALMGSRVINDGWRQDGAAASRYLRRKRRKNQECKKRGNRLKDTAVKSAETPNSKDKACRIRQGIRTQFGSRAVMVTTISRVIRTTPWRRESLTEFLGHRILCMMRRSRSVNRLPIIIYNRGVIVIKPIPPNCINTRRITWPNRESVAPTLNTLRPVTHTAEVAVKAHQKKRRDWPSATAAGRDTVKMLDQDHPTEAKNTRICAGLGFRAFECRSHKKFLP